jgi:alpha-D-xyloside xylohydrolase
MVLEYPDDPACAQLDRQYMLGDSILVAPVFSPEGTVEYYLPEGLWTSLIDGRAIRGGRWIREKHGYMSLPLLAREGAMIASGACEDRPDYDYPQDALVTIYSPPDGWTSSICVPLMDGEPGLSLEARRVGDRIFLEAGGSEKPWRLAVSGLEIGGAAGMRLSSEGDRALLVPEKAAGSYEIALGRSRP